MPDALGHCKILNLVGIGRIGELYRARDMRAGRTVALRVVAEEIAADPDRRRRLMRDAAAAAALSHPNIAALYEVGEDQGYLFLASEYVPGETLQTLLAGRALNPRHAIDFAVQLADALAEGHAAGIVYRDLRPANIVITPRGTAKLLDFGLGAWTAGGAGHAFGSTARQGDPGPALQLYSSPEQVSGEAGDQRSDLFSLGVVLMEMLTGKPPFVGATADDLVVAIREAQVPPPSTLNRMLPSELDAVVLKMLAKRIDQRYELAAIAAADLRSMADILDASGNRVIAESRTDATRNPRTGTERRGGVHSATLRRKHTAIWLGFVLVLGAIVGTLVLTAPRFVDRWLPSFLRTGGQSEQTPH